MDSDITLQDGTVDITGDKLHTSVSNVELYYYGGHLLANGGDVELGSTDSGALKGFRQSKNGNVYIVGTNVQATGGNVSINGSNVVDVCAPKVMLESAVGSGEGSSYVTSVEVSAMKLQAGTTFNQPNGSTFHGVTLQTAGGATTLNINADSTSLTGQIDGKNVGVTITPQAHSVILKGLVQIKNPWVNAPDTKARIALQQDDQDRLVLNASSFFTGGVRIEGETHFAGVAVVEKDLKLLGGLSIVEEKEFVDPRTHKKDRIQITTNLVETIDSLRAQVADLQNKVAAQEEQLKKLMQSR